MTPQPSIATLRPSRSCTVANAGHFAFLPSCSPGQARALAQICADPEGFDRAAFHGEFDRQVIAFFHAHLLSQR
jgi:predicted dienelactone hydrolase